MCIQYNRSPPNDARSDNRTIGQSIDRSILSRDDDDDVMMVVYGYTVRVRPPSREREARRARSDRHVALGLHPPAAGRARVVGVTPIHALHVTMSAITQASAQVAKTVAVSTGKVTNAKSMMVWKPHGNKYVFVFDATRDTRAREGCGIIRNGG